jgi:hypothetical protein
MAEIRTVTALLYKRSEILSSIENYKKRLAQAISGNSFRPCGFTRGKVNWSLTLMQGRRGLVAPAKTLVGRMCNFTHFKAGRVGGTLQQKQGGAP